MKRRLLVLGAAAALSLASASSHKERKGDVQAAPSNGGRERVAGPPGAYQCFSLRQGTSLTSLCFGTAARCERERRAADADGGRASRCEPTAPVSCFQLGGSKNPSMELCAANADDCELWRLVDYDKNGKTGDLCRWKHAVR